MIFGLGVSSSTCKSNGTPPNRQNDHRIFGFDYKYHIFVTTK
jgi:hypothetical protein